MKPTNCWDTVHLVPPTPFSADGRAVDTDRLAGLVDRCLNAGITVVIPAAGTGEFHSLSIAESINCISTTINICKNRARVLAPIGIGLEHAISVGEKAMAAGADGVLVMPPVHPYLGDEGVGLYFKAIRQALGVPIWVYKRGPNPSDAMLVSLANEGVIAGVKYAVNDLNALTDFVRKTAGKCEVVCGTAERNAPFYHLAGARGFTSGAAALFPEISLKLHEALTCGNYAEAMRLRELLNPIEAFRARQNDALNITTVKAGLELMGQPVGPVRPPNRPLTTAETAELKQVITTIQNG